MYVCAHVAFHYEIQYAVVFFFIPLYHVHFKETT